MLQHQLISEVSYLKLMGIKPNFSELSRKYDVDRHTIAKYHKKGGIPERKHFHRPSVFDDFKDEIIELCKTPGITKVGIFEFLLHKYGEKFHNNLSSFKSYMIRNGLNINKTPIVPHVRYETKPGSQLQVDWKETLKMETIDGEIIDFNIYSATLGFSRLHLFIYSKTKTTEDFLRCTIDAFRKIGGIPKNILTDNMSAVVSITNGYKEKHKKIKQFEKDLGIRIQLCKARTPQTKGKDESCNRFVNRLKAYDKQFKNEEELIKIIEYIQNRSNLQINATTNLPPIKLFQKEKEYLSPLPNSIMIDSYIENICTTIVENTLLIRYKGSGYSVPAKYIGKRVKTLEIDNQLYIYYNNELITVHDINSRLFNYKQTHYEEALRTRISSKTDDEINAMASSNLELFDKIRK